jgi:hypothetical protein
VSARRDVTWSPVLEGTFEEEEEDICVLNSRMSRTHSVSAKEEVEEEESQLKLLTRRSRH